MEAMTIEGHALTSDDMYDGMVLTSMAGYPILIHLDPFRMNNVTVSTKERNLRYKNGIIHRLVQYPKPLVPWMKKTIIEVLQETNERRNGDISSFIALIDVLPDMTIQFQATEGNYDATTLFVPTNDALASWDPRLAAEVQSQQALNSTLRQFLKSHMVSGNFAINCWWNISTGTKVSDKELKLETNAGHELLVEINDVVTINGDVNIIQGDIFAEQGVIHVIDKPLLLLQ